MKRNKWQRLAAIGLCSSLLVNAFSGVTAVAETVTIESSPTAESSTKEETPASSVKEETTKASTENSQVTTDTSQEEETKEIEKQAEKVINDQLLPDVELPNLSNKASVISPRAGQDSTIYPRIQMEFVDELGAPFTEKLSLNGKYTEYARRRDNGSFQRTTVSAPIISSQATTNKYNVFTQAGVTVTANIGEGNYPTSAYYLRGYFLDTLSIANTLNYVDKIEFIPKTMYTAKYDAGKVALGPPIEVTAVGASAVDMQFKKNAQNLFSITSILGTTNTNMSNILAVNTIGATYDTQVRLVGFDGTAAYKETLSYKITRKQVTEKFVNTSGVAITPPTGFTQNKKTPMTSNAFTFKQAGTLPDTYTAGGKTYKFKGWYKGKTKTEPLKTTKAPSYGVTYDDNDDLNVVYEELIPKDTWVYPGFHAEFVDEKGQAFNEPLTFSGNYTQTLRKAVDQTYVTTGAMNPLVSIKNTNKANIYTITTQSRVNVPANFDEVPSAIYDMRTYAINDWNITTELKYIDKIETMNTTLPVSEYPVGFVGTDPVFNNSGPGQLNEIDKSFKKGVDNKFSIKATFGVGSSVNTVPRLLLVARATGNPENKIVLHGFDGTQDFKQTMNYKVTRKQVTENFVDVNGAKITPPTGFTQGNQIPMTSNTFKYTAAKALPATYTAGGKTYTFQGWYKGKTKPSTLNQTTTPTFNATFDGNDDMTAMYKEETVTTLYPSINVNFVDEKGVGFTPVLTFSGKYYAQSASANLRTDLYDVVSKNNGNGQYTVSVNNGSIPLSQELLKKYNNGQPISTTNRLRFNVDKLTIDQPLKYVDSIQVDTVQSSQLKSYKYMYKSDNSLIFDPNVAPVETDISSTDISILKFTSNGTYFTNSNSRFLNMHVGYGSTGDNYNFATYLFNTNPVNQTKLVYKVTRKQVTEKFVDANGVAITPPAGFTQNKKTTMTSNAFTFKQSGALPDTHTTGGKTYKFKGWYKGKTKPATLKTTKTPSYAVTYDGNADLNVVYEEIQNTVTLPDRTYRVLFINETGGMTFANNYGFSGELVEVADGNVTPIGPVPTADNSAVKEITVPGRVFDKERPTALQYGVRNATFTLPKMYKKATYQPGPNYKGTVFPIPETYRLSLINGTKSDSDTTGWRIGLDATKDPQKFTMSGVYWSSMPAGVMLATLLSATITGKGLEPTVYTLDENARMYLYLENRRVTENFVDTSGAKITPPTGFTQGKQTVITSDDYTFKQAGTLPDTYTTGGKTYNFKGWYKGKTKTEPLKTTKAPSYGVTYDDNDDLNVVYEEEIPTASVTLTRPKEVIDTNTNVIWTTTITNTSKAPLQNLTLKKGPNWSAGLTIPTFMEVRPEGETTKSIPVNSTLWTDGVSLPNAVPIGKKVSVAFTTRATGNPNTVLKAEVVVFGGIKDRTVDNFVRIRPNDQEVVTPTTEGFISVPTFDFGQVGVAGSKQQHNLKQAADYYGNGTRNPYVRIKKTQPNWSLTAQLSQPKSATDSLPTATRLLLGAAPVSSFTNYNQPTELKNAVGTTSAISLTANNMATSIIANKQFTGSNVYQLDFTFNNVKLEVPANQGIKGQQYKAAVTWNLVTGP